MIYFVESTIVVLIDFMESIHDLFSIGQVLVILVIWHGEFSCKLDKVYTLNSTGGVIILTGGVNDTQIKNLPTWELWYAQSNFDDVYAIGH